MSRAAIEINDTGIVLLSEGAKVPRGISPGYAQADTGRVVFGREAMDQARLRPRSTTSRYWEALDTQPLAAPFPPDISSADLVYGHLSQIWEPLRTHSREVLLAVPGHYDAAQLGLLLGIARSAGLPVQGLIDSGLAASAGRGSHETRLHVDVHLHRVTATELLCGQELVRGRVESLEGVGLVQLRDTWAKCFAEAFVRQTRFDPLHGAESEQALHNHLPKWLTRLSGEGFASVRLDTAGGGHSVELEASKMLAAVAHWYERIVAFVAARRTLGEKSTLLLSSRIADLPGIRQRFAAQHDGELFSLPEVAAAAGALHLRDQLHSSADALPFVTRLSAHALPSYPSSVDVAAPPPMVVASPSSRTAARPRPSHLVHGATAYALVREPLHLGKARGDASREVLLEGDLAGVSRNHCRVFVDGPEVVVEDQSTYGSFLNGARIEGRAVVHAGDRLRVGSPGVELLFVSEVREDGSPNEG
jgi:hypothetical protein